MVSKHFDDETEMAKLVEIALRRYPDEDPATVERMVRQALRLQDYDAHRGLALVFVLELLDRGVTLDSVMSILASVKSSLIAQRLDEGLPHPDVEES